MKGNKNKRKIKESESLPPSSLVLACLLAPPHNLNQSKYNMFPRIIF
jgi:hypothetical protein